MSNVNSSKISFQPLDRLAITVAVILSAIIGLLIWSGDRTLPQVREFSWQGKQVGADDMSFIMTFNRPMDHESVEKNLKIAPSLPGKFSWAGRRMAYTLTAPATYGKSYKLELTQAFDRFANEVKNHSPIQPFAASFSTPDPAFAYIGAKGDQTGRLIVYDLALKQARILTPPDMTVSEFRIYPNRDQILFTATPNTGQTSNLLDQKLYTVTIPIAKDREPEIKLILDSGEYQNFKFDLSADGQIIVVQRLSRLVPGKYGLWVIKANSAPQPLENQPGGDFLITPDSSAVAVLQGEGVAILPLEPQAQPLDFLPKFGNILSFSRDGSQGAMVKFNKDDYSRALFRVTNQGVQQQLLRSTGSILSAQFDPQKQTIYCLLTDVTQTEKTYQEEPYLAAIDIKTTKLKRLADLKGQRNVQISLAADGSAILFDRIATETSSGSSDAQEPSRSNDSEASVSESPEQVQPIRTHKIQGTPRIQILSLTTSTPEIESLPLYGSHPRWLP
jgi:hypothetical protein